MAPTEREREVVATSNTNRTLCASKLFTCIDPIVLSARARFRGETEMEPFTERRGHRRLIGSQSKSVQ